MEKVTSALTIISEWIFNLFRLHLYWIAGSLLGGIIFGIVPSTIALFSTVRQLILKKKAIHLFQYFKKDYIYHFKNSRFIDLIYLATAFSIVSFISFIRSTSDSWLAYTHIFILVFSILLILFSIYLIPVFIHYQMDNKEIIQNTFIIMIVNMKWNIPMLLSVLAVILLHVKFSVTLLFFGISITSFVILLYCLKTFEEFEKKRIEINEG